MTVVLFPDPPGSEENQRSRLCVKSVGRGGEGRGGKSLRSKLCGDSTGTRIIILSLVPRPNDDFAVS